MSSALRFSSKSSKLSPFASAQPAAGAGLFHIPLLDDVSAAVIVTDSGGTIMFWNAFAEKLYGWTREEVLGRNIMALTVSSDTEEEAKKHMAALSAGHTWSGEFHVRCKSGEFLAALVALSPIVDESGTVSGIVGVSQDLSQYKQAEQAARAALEERVQERTAELKRANDSLRDLSARLLQMRDQEARRLARELHDSVGQLLVAIGMNISTVQAQAHKLDAAGERAVADNAFLVEQISNEIRTISHLLHPPLLDEAGLAPALRWYVDAFSERSKIKIEMETPSELRLPTDIEIAIFRVVQECLTNIHRHSGSKTATIRIRLEAGKILVLAQDFGAGIPDDKLRLISDGQSGVGFRGMRERIQYLGGRLELHSDRTGTRVAATLPLAGKKTAQGGSEAVALP